MADISYNIANKEALDDLQQELALHLADYASFSSGSTVTDLNAISKTGFYACFANSENAPETASNSLFTILHLQPDPTRRFQIAIKISGTFYWRAYHSSAWTSWMKIPSNLWQITGGITLASETDLDDLYGEEASGNYQLVSARTYYNAPSTSGMLIVNSASNSATSQQFINSTIFKVRFRTSSAWSSWRDA